MSPSNNSRVLPSSRWPSYDPWDYNGMKERPHDRTTKLDTSALVSHVQQVGGQKIKMSNPFSAGQYWVAFEMVVEDGTLVVARARLPKHPDMPDTYSEKDEKYLMEGDEDSVLEMARLAFILIRNVGRITFVRWKRWRDKLSPVARGPKRDFKRRYNKHLETHRSNMTHTSA